MKVFIFVGNVQSELQALTDQEDLSLLGFNSDYYDPEDLTDDENLKAEERERDPDIGRALGIENPGIEDDPEVDPRFESLFFCQFITSAQRYFQLCFKGMDWI